MLLNEFFQSLVLPQRWDVCGIKVQALSCWHLYALEQLDNAYAFSAEVATYDDAAGLLLICQHDFGRGRKLFLSQGGIINRAVKLSRKLKRIPWDELDSACRDYTDTCKELPEVWGYEKKGGKSLGGSHVWHVVTCLMALGRSEDAAWNMPYTRARCYYAIHSEAQGVGEILSDHSRRLLAQAKTLAGAK